MDKILKVLEFVFGCWHRNLSRPFTLSGWTYEVCLNCGRKFSYDRIEISAGVSARKDLSLDEDCADMGSLCEIKLTRRCALARSALPPFVPARYQYASVRDRTSEDTGLQLYHVADGPTGPPPRGLTADRAKLCAKLTAVCLILLAGAPLYGQSDLTATSRGTGSYGAPSFAVQETSSSDLQQQSPYLGGVPAGKASPTALSLSLEDAVARGLRQNLGGLLSTDAVSGARGERWQALSALLPDLTTATSFSVKQIDLKVAHRH